MKKVFCFIFVLLLIASLAISAFADDFSDSRESPHSGLNESRYVDTFYSPVFVSYSFLNDDVLDRGSGISELFTSSAPTIDLLFSDGSYLRLDYSLSRSYSLNSYYSVYDYLFSSVLYRSIDGTLTYTSESQAPLLIDNDGIYCLSYGFSGAIFIDSTDMTSKILTNDLTFRVFDSDSHSVFYFGCMEDDFADELSYSNFIGYCLSFGSSSGSSGLFGWIESQLLPLFGDVPTTPIDFGNLGTWYVQDIVRLFLWVSLGGVCACFFVILPYHLFLRLIGVKKRKKGKT